MGAHKVPVPIGKENQEIAAKKKIQIEEKNILSEKVESDTDLESEHLSESDTEVELAKGDIHIHNDFDINSDDELEIADLENMLNVLSHEKENIIKNMKPQDLEKMVEIDTTSHHDDEQVLDYSEDEMDLGELQSQINTLLS